MILNVWFPLTACELITLSPAAFRRKLRSDSEQENRRSGKKAVPPGLLSLLFNKQREYSPLATPSTRNDSI